MVKLHEVREAEGGLPAVVDLVVSAPQADFTFTGMTHVYRDVWNRPPHTRSDIALRDATGGFNSPGKYGFDLDTVQVDDDGYLIAIGQPGFNFAGYPGFSWKERFTPILFPKGTSRSPLLPTLRREISR